MRRVSRYLAAATFSLFLVTQAPLPAAAREAPSIEARAGQLRPGQFVWAPDRAENGEVEIVVSLPLQRAWVFRGGALIGVTTISSGQPGYDTPVGRFAILQKRVDHYSNLYDNAPMPFMQRLTWDGVALHAGQISGTPESHGCIRLPRAFAQRLYAVTALGTSVLVTDQAPNAPEEALALASAA